MSGRQAGPPRAAVKLLRWLLPDPVGAAVQADLDNLFRERAQRAGQGAAKRWYWRQTMRAIIPGVQTMVPGLDAIVPGLSTGWRRGPSERRPATDLAHDLRYAFRSLRHAPSYACVVVVTLALGVGASTAIFSVLRAVTLEPLAYEAPDELAMIWLDAERVGVRGWPLGGHDLVDYGGADSIAAIGAVTSSYRLALVGIDNPFEVDVVSGTDNLFELIGVVPMLGPGWAAGDGVVGLPGAVSADSPASAAMALISYDFWRNHFAADPSAVGTTLKLRGIDAQIAGVLPADFRFWMHPRAGVDPNPDVWLAGRFESEFRNIYPYNGLARLAPGVSVAATQQELNAVNAGQQAEYGPYERAQVTPRLVPLAEDLMVGSAPILWMVFAAVSLLMLVTAVNVASLMLFRATRRMREVAIRLALGASRGSLARHFLMESALVAVASAVLGTALAYACLRWLVVLAPSNVPRLESARIDPLVLAYGLGMSLLAALAAGVFPSLYGSRPERAMELRASSKVALGQHPALRKGLVAAQVAISFVLLIGSVHMAQAFMALRDVDLGFEPEGVLGFAVRLPVDEYATVDERQAFRLQFDERLAAIPGVESVGGITRLPLSSLALSGGAGTYATEEVEAAGDPTGLRTAVGLWVWPGFFETVGAELVEGRLLTAADQQSGLPLIVVSDHFARLNWPGESAVGKRIFHKLRAADAEWAEVVGVIRHLRMNSLDGEPAETVYGTLGYVGPRSNAFWVVRAAGDPNDLVPQIRRELAALDASLPISRMTTLEDLVYAAEAPTRFTTLLMLAFSGSGLLLAMVGLQGMLVQYVRERTPEIGVRLALGASSRSVLGLVVRVGLTPVVLGWALGVAGAAALAGVLASVAAQFAPSGAGVYVLATAAFALIAVAGCAVPLLLALRVDPIEAIRTE